MKNGISVSVDQMVGFITDFYDNTGEKCPLDRGQLRIRAAQVRNSIEPEIWHYKVLAGVTSETSAPSQPGKMLNFSNMQEPGLLIIDDPKPAVWNLCGEVSGQMNTSGLDVLLSAEEREHWNHALSDDDQEDDEYFKIDIQGTMCSFKRDALIGLEERIRDLLDPADTEDDAVTAEAHLTSDTWAPDDFAKEFPTWEDLKDYKWSTKTPEQITIDLKKAAAEWYSAGSKPATALRDKVWSRNFALAASSWVDSQDDLLARLDVDLPGGDHVDALVQFSKPRFKCLGIQCPERAAQDTPGQCYTCGCAMEVIK